MEILIADDERAIREGVRRTIRRTWPDCGVYLAASAEEAVSMLEAQEIDIVLTDILMPGVSGLELMKIMKRKYPRVKWVVISAHGEFSYAQEAVRLGARDYLLKPIGKNRLYEIIGSLEEEIRLESENFKEGERLRAGFKYVREGVFQRLTLGLDVSSSDMGTLTDEYREFYLVYLQMNTGNRSVRLEHFIVDNVLGELFEAYGRGFVISYDANSLLGLFTLGNRAGIGEFQDKAKTQMSRCLKVPFQMVVSGKNNDIAAIPQLVAQMRAACAVHASEPEPLKGSGDKAIEIALEYIQGHYCEELSLEKTAAAVFLNPAYFSQLFKQKTGQGYKEYVTSLRLEQAKLLLMNPRLKLAEIAEQVGYQDMRHFTQVFRKRFDLTPTEYRQRQRINILVPGEGKLGEAALPKQ
ncbi:response regulator [Paenibacillus sp. M1]|uniref:Response regulator n=1 Tax=Paenibacillus haidiansis TaxID=1574488 RepID=A0ABU7VTH3_9BACL